jgi:thioredoxin-related protein
MQKFLILITSVLFFTFLAGPLYSQEKPKEKTPDKSEKIKWLTFEEAYKLNKKKPKKIFIDVYTDWCGWCKKMDAETFTHPVIAEYMSKHFYCVKFNAECKDTIVLDGVTFVNKNPGSKRSTHQLAIELLKGKLSYPSLVFLNEQGQWITVIQSYFPPTGFEPLIHFFGENAYLKSSWEEYKSTFTGEIK